jgi:glycosyltransferase involved in cell wall biosynthesis
MAAVDVSVVIPAFNEEAGLEKNISEVVSTLAGWNRSWEIILINDGSTDGTLAVMESLAASDTRIQLVSYRDNRGRGYALRTGIGAAGGETVVTTEADLTWGTDIIIRLVEALESSDKDIIIASPFAPQGKMVNVPLNRALISRLGNRFLRSSIPADVTMVSGMTRAYRKTVLDSLEFESDGKEFHVEVLFKAVVLGFQIGEIPATLRWEPTRAGEPKRRSSLSIPRMVWGHVILWLLEKPVFLFGALGLLLVLAGVAGGAYITYLRFAGGLNPERPLMTLVIILLLGGFQILAFGFVATLLIRLRNEVFRIQKENRTILTRLED